MTEQEFMEELRLRINQSNDLASLGYCDFLVTKRYFVGPPQPRIEGSILFIGDKYGWLQFSLMLPDNTENLDDISWNNLLPTESSHGWARLEDGGVIIDAFSS
jgi:hypothetical protein